MEKHLKLTLHFTIKGKTDDVTSNDPEEHGYIERQKSLYQALVSNKDSLDKYERYLLVGWLEGQGDGLEDLILEDVEPERPWGHREAKAILIPLIGTMSKEDQQFFHDANAGDVFYESTEIFHDFFSTNLDRWECTEVENE